MKTFKLYTAVLFAFIAFAAVLAMNRFKPARIALYKLLKLP
jgi:hypothetical protein